MNKGLAQKVVTFEKQILSETKRRQELERRFEQQPVTLNNINRMHNYS